MSKGKTGRPKDSGKYDKNITPILAEGWAREGLNNEQIANNLGIHISTLYEWQNIYPDFSEALKKGKEVVDFKVENALYKKAIGYDYIEITQRIIKNENGEEEIKETIKYNKVQHPSDRAIEIWLRNRKPDKWGEKEKEKETQPPIVNIEIKDNSEIQKEFDKFDT